MPRYLFHIVDGELRPNSVRDSDGTVLRDATEARKEAIGLAQDIAKHRLDGATKWKVVVTDEGGGTVLTVPLSQVLTLRVRVWSTLRDLVYGLVYRSPRTLAWSLAAGVIVLQAVALGVLMQQDPGTYQTASAPSQGAVVAIRFVRTAMVVDITRLMETYHGSIVDGPRAGGFYRVRLSDTALPKDDFAQLVARMSQDDIVEFAAAVE
jgi:uncharacterized protein DUF6894